MVEDIEYFENKRPDRTYISKAFGASEENPRKLRIISKVLDPSATHQFAKIKDELVLRITEGRRQEVKAVFYEDNRTIDSLTIQRYTRKDGKPHKASFTFRGDEIRDLYRFIRLIKGVRLNREEKERLDDEILDDIIVSANEKRRFLLGNTDLVLEIARNDITKSDVVALAYRREQLKVFDQLLHDKGFFAAKKAEWKKRGDESVWQQFFEDNPWIFGYGLQYVFTSRLMDRRLEQVVAGASVFGGGKRVDALLRTLGAISSLCFVELKTHQTALLAPRPYREQCWRISDELAGAVAQVQKTVHKAERTIRDKWQASDSEGEPMSETTFLFHPKSFVVVGDLHQFVSEPGVNEQKFSSFELFRRALVNPEVLTYDELFERARCIVEHSEKEKPFTEAAEDAGTEVEPAHSEAERIGVIEPGDPDVYDDVPF